MAARVSRISDITLRAVIALCLASLCVVQSAAHPRRADAVPIAIPIVVGVGAVLATVLGVYGVQAVNSDRSTADIGTSFISWITSKDLDDFWDAQTDIKSAQMAIDAIYQMGLDGSMALGDWTTNEQNAIYSTYGALLSMWAADGFAATPPVAGSSASFGDLNLGLFYSDLPSYDYVLNVPESMYNQFTLPITASFSIGNDYYVFYNTWTGSNAAIINASRRNVALVLGANGTWALTSDKGSGYTRLFDNFSGASMYSDWLGSAATVNSSSSSWFGQRGGTFADLSFNTYNNLRVFSVSYDINDAYASFISSNTNPYVSYSSQVAYYDATLDLWTGDVSIDTGIEGDLFDKFSDALSQGIDDILSQQIPLGADYVYNPSTQALEQQGSVPVIQDWSRVADWADVLERIRAGTLDGSQVIDNTTTGVRADTISDTLVEGEAIQDWPMRSWETPSQEIGTIGAALNFTGETIGEKFPFSTWGDVVAISNILAVDAVAPEFDMPVIGFDGSGFTVERVHISLAGFEGVAIVIRLMFLILMILGVIWLAVRQLKAFQGV